MVNVTHHHLGGDDWDAGEQTAAATAWSDFFDSYKSDISEEVTFKECRFYHFDPSDPLPRTLTLDGVVPVGTPGSDTASHTLPPQCAITVTWRTSIRRSWGRIYLGGWTDAARADGRITETLASAIADGALDFANALSSGGTDLIVWSEPHGELTITEIECDDVWDVIRRRRYAMSMFRNLRTPS
jgi:hypothetical protein